MNSFQKSGLFVVLIVFVSGTLIAAANKGPKPNKAIFSQTYAQKLVNDEGPQDSEAWSWKFSGTVYGDFSDDIYFQDDTPIEILIGDFSTSAYFETLAEIKGYLNAEDETDDALKKLYQKLRGKWNVNKEKKKASIKYNFVYPWEKELPDDTKTMYKKTGSMSLKWNNKSFSFSISVNISAADFYFKGLEEPSYPIEIAPIEEPEVDPSPEKTYTLGELKTGTFFAQIAFGNYIVSKRGFGYLAKKKFQRLVKGKDKDEYPLQSHKLKEIKHTAVLILPSKPIAVADAIETEFGTPVEIEVLNNDTCYLEDVFGNDVNLFICEISDPLDQNGEKCGILRVLDDEGNEVDLSKGELGTVIEYIPPTDKFFKGKVEFTYKAKDIIGLIKGNEKDRTTDAAKVFVYVQKKDKNNQPFAVDDVTHTAPGKSIEIDVLANDIDLDEGDMLSVDVSIPENGEAEIIKKGGKSLIKYTPLLGYISGEDEPDTFDYSISDGHGGYATATVYVYVETKDKNNPPVAKNLEVKTPINESIDIDVLQEASDPDKDDKILGIAALINPPSNGKIETDGIFITYTPNINFAGTDSFHYKITDFRGGISEEATVTVTMKIPPVAYDDVVEINPSETVEIDVLQNDKAGSVSKDNLIVTIPESLKPKHGTAEVEDDNTISYSPDDDFIGIDSFVYLIDDKENGISNATVTIFVGQQNNNTPPVAADDVLYAVKDDDTELKVLLNDTDPDGDKLRIFEITQNPLYGRVWVMEDKLFYTSEPPSMEEDEPDYDPNYKKTDSFKYLVSDKRGGIAEASVSLKINTAPYPVPDNFETKVNNPIVISLSQLLSNDYDEEGDILEITSITQPTNGTAVLDGNNVIYTPNENYVGQDSFLYQVEDYEVKNDGKGSAKGAKASGNVIVNIH